MSKRRFFLPGHLLVWVLAFAPVCCAQEYRGRVQGIVSDASDAVVAAAKVTLLNAATGVSTLRETDTRGYYLFDMVLPGTYEVSVEMNGFNRFVQKNVLVQTRADVTVNARLELGGISQTVTVDAAPVQVNFNTTSMELTMDTKTVQQLPLIDRNPFLLAAIDPAVMLRYQTTTPYGFWSMTTIEIGGSQTYRANEVLLDGNPAQLSQKGSYSPPVDAVSEITVMQNSVDAEYGATAGGVLNVSMKSGSNSLHGAVHYFGRQPKLNARPNPMTTAGNDLKLNSWGGHAGFPVVKNRIFNFVAYEGWKRSSPNFRQNTAPTAREREGDFSQTLNTQGTLRQIFDPLTTVFDSRANRATRTPFAGNMIPKNRLDLTAMAMVQDLWLPNGPGRGPDGVLNFQGGSQRIDDYLNFSNRTDWVVNDKLRVFGRASIIRTDLGETDFTGLNSKMAGLYFTAADSTSIAGDVVYTLSPTTVINIRGGLTTMIDTYDPKDMRLSQADLDRLWRGNPYYRPYLKIRGVDNPLFYPLIQLDGASYTRDNFWIGDHDQYSLNGKLAKQHGRHYFKIGGEWRRYERYGTWQRAGMSTFRFNTAHTADTFLSPNTRLYGYNWATFLLGALDNQSSIAVQPISNPHYSLFGFYFQDDFKLNRRLTLNLGLRWEYEPGFFDSKGRFSRPFDMDDPIPEMQSSPPVIPQDARALMNQTYRFTGAWRFTDGPGQSLFDPYKFAFSPRAGLALRLNDRMSVRAGYARFVTPFHKENGNVGAQMPMPGYDASTTVAPALEGKPQAFLSNPFPASNPLILPVEQALGRYTNLGAAVSWWKGDLRPMVNDRINVSFQRALPEKFLVDITYFVNLGHDLPYTRQFNMMDPQLSYQHKSQLNRAVANPFYNYLTPETFPGQLRNQRTVTLGSLLKPFPQYGNVSQQFTAGPRMRYNSVQIKVQRPFAGGYNFLLGYNYNQEKQEELFSSDQEFLNQFQWERSTSMRHKLTMAAVADLPFGRGRRFLPAAHPVVDAVLGGWSVSGYYTFLSGDSLRFGALQVVGDPVLDSPSKWGQWFSSTAFQIQTPFTPRTNPKWFPDLWGPGAHNLDASLSKYFPITERFRLEFRMESQNFTNTFNAANPNGNIAQSTFGKITGPRAIQLGSGRQFQYNRICLPG